MTNQKNNTTNKLTDKDLKKVSGGSYVGELPERPSSMDGFCYHCNTRTKFVLNNNDYYCSVCGNKTESEITAI